VTAPYYTDDVVQLYLGDCREVLPALGVAADLVLADPPYGETTLAWDRWPDEWVQIAASVSSSLWRFGSMRMFLQHSREFEAAGWKLSQDIVWEKHNGSGFAADRFRRVHEVATHWYRGPWTGIHHDTPRVAVTYRTRGNASGGQPDHTGVRGHSTWSDDGTRLVKSVLQIPNMWRRGAIHPTEKPLALLDPLIRYACPPGGLVVDPFAGSAATLVAARGLGRRAIGIEGNEKYAEKAARRLAAVAAQRSLFDEVIS
jgi:site-specific DNA-methyltransferase (adenine-specific)